MAVLDLAEAKLQLSDWLAASRAVAKGQSYSVAGRALTRADAKEIREAITFWDLHVSRLNRGGIRVRGITPIL